MRFRSQVLGLSAHAGQLLLMDYYIKVINLVLGWADATEGVPL